MKVIAYYLPQFHRIPENDLWWGEGFTEWSNTKKASPLFSGHNQPRVPYHDFYYDLTDPKVREWQAQIAKEYGIYGFCYYHYWFEGGKRLLERPFNEVLNSKAPDFPFCLCWANEPWTRRWDGDENEILMPQHYGGEKEWEEHFNYLLEAFQDKRYIRIDNKPVFLIYRPAHMERCEEMMQYWEMLAKKNGLEGLYIVESLGWYEQSNITMFSAQVEFEPMYTLRQLFLEGDSTFSQHPSVFDYDEVFNRSLTREENDNHVISRYLGAFVDWDNTARKGMNSVILHGASPEKFGNYLQKQFRRTLFRDHKHPFVFINAWNEWAEGNYLEPDKKYEYRYLEEVRKAVNIAESTQAVYDSLQEILVKIKNDIQEEYLNSLLVYVAEGDLTAIELHSLIFKEIPNPNTIYNFLGVKCYEHGLLSEAIFFLQKLLELEPSNDDALFNLGCVFERCGKFDLALNSYRKMKLKDSDVIAIIENVKKQVSCKVSIIIPVYNKVEYTAQCLESLIRETKNIQYEIIVVDNASTDGTKEFLSSLNDQCIHVISNEQNIGFVGACNIGANASCGKYLLFLNNDTTLTENWLTELVDLAESDPMVGVVGSKLVYPNGLLQEAGGIIWQDASGWNYGRGDNPNKPEYSFVREVDYVSGACLLINQELFEKVGGFDERYAPGYYEDTDLCFSVRELGYKVLYQPRSVVIHYEGISSGTDLTSGMKQYQVLNKQKFIEKWERVLQKQFRSDSRNVLRASVRQKGKNILIVDPSMPLYDRASGSLRLFQIIRSLRNAGHYVTYIARNGLQQEKYVDILQRMGVEVYSTDRKKMRDLGYWITGPTIDLGDILTARHYEVAWLSFYDIAEQYLKEIRFYSPKTQIVIDTVDVHYLREERMAEISGDIKLRQQAVQTMQRELSIYSQADKVITVTEQDGMILQGELSDLKWSVIPNIHDPIDNTTPYEKREDLLFIGNFSHTPNIDAMDFFLRDLWPRIKRKLPGVKLFIVGNRAEEFCMNEDSDVIVLGFVPDTQPFVQRCRVSIAPLRYGAGMKGKIGEAIMSGLPVVTTSIGSEGMGMSHGTHVLVADSADMFIDEVERLYNDPKLWQDLMTNGKQLMRERYSSDKVSELLLQLLTELTAV